MNDNNTFFGPSVLFLWKLAGASLASLELYCHPKLTAYLIIQCGCHFCGFGSDGTKRRLCPPCVLSLFPHGLLVLSWEARRCLLSSSHCSGSLPPQQGGRGWEARRHCRGTERTVTCPAQAGICRGCTSAGANVRTWKSRGTILLHFNPRPANPAKWDHFEIGSISVMKMERGG